MSKAELTVLAEKVEKGIATEQELSLYLAACDSIHLAFINDPVQNNDLSEDLSQLEAASLARFWKQQQQQANPVKIFPLWKKLIPVAAAVAAILIGVYFFKFDHAAQIKPGKNTATLTFSNGKTVELSDAKTGVAIQGTSLAYTDGTSIPVTELESKELTATTPKGGTYQFTLPDGTKVWLNSASTISFPVAFAKSERKVQLVGEAYFEVRHNAQQPFKVYSKGQVVEDIGTEFNINAYGDEPEVRTTLVEGLAKVNNHLLNPGQQAQLRGTDIKIVKANINAEVAWRKGEFVFDDESIGSIMRKLSRWYDIEVIYQDVDPSETFGGSISRFENVAKVLQNLELTGEIHFKISGRKIYVMP